MPPKPPILSRPVTKLYCCFVLARPSSAGVGPLFARRAISSVTIRSISASEAPGRAVATTANQPEISAEFWNDCTAVQSCLS